jgi:hypothetical protein
MIGRSTQSIVEIVGIAGIAEITKIANCNPQLGRRRDCSIALPTQKSGVRFIVLQDMMWKSTKLFWITRRCRHQHRWHKNPVEVNIIESILITRIRWLRSM